MLVKPNQKLGRRLRTARLRLGWTQAAAAEWLGASERSVKGWEAGAFAPIPIFQPKLEALILLAAKTIAPSVTVATRNGCKAVQQ